MDSEEKDQNLIAETLRRKLLDVSQINTESSLYVQEPSIQKNVVIKEEINEENGISFDENDCSYIYEEEVKPFSKNKSNEKTLEGTEVIYIKEEFPEDPDEFSHSNDDRIFVPESHQVLPDEIKLPSTSQNNWVVNSDSSTNEGTCSSIVKKEKKIYKTYKRKKNFECYACEYQTVWRSDIIKHLRTHTGEKPFKCSFCSYGAARKCNLQIHLRTHTGERPYKCHFCEYSAARKLNLQIHLRTHTGEKPFKCTNCSFTTSHQSELRLHLRTHTGERPFKCTFCPHTAARKGSLLIHIRTHTGEKPFKCHLCTYRAAQKSLLQNHLKSHNDIPIQDIQDIPIQDIQDIQ